MSDDRVRRLKVFFVKPVRNEGEEAWIETEDGYYLFSVHQTGGEGKRRFRKRARSLVEAVERYGGSIVTLSPDQC